MRRIWIATVFLSAFAAAGVEARQLPGPTSSFGPNCKALHRATGQSVLFVGTVMGGRETLQMWGDGTKVDYRTFQGCFVSQDRCEAWTAGHARRHGRQPAYVRCTSVMVGLRP